ELRTAETFDEVAAAARAQGLECTQLRVDRAVAARNPLAAHAVARDDALPLEQQLCERAPIRLGAREQPGRQRPATLGRGHGCRPCTGEAAHTAVGTRCLVAALR